MCAGRVTDFATHIGMGRSYHLIMALHPERDPIDEEIDRLTDWNVPSWNDLIGSLYRPER